MLIQLPFGFIYYIFIPYLATQPWLTQQLPLHYWSTLSHQRNYFNWLAEGLNIHHRDGWYSVKMLEITKYPEVRTILSHYQGYLSLALEKIYPDTQWKHWLFEQRLPPNYWSDISHRRIYLIWLAEQLKVKQSLSLCFAYIYIYII